MSPSVPRTASRRSSGCVSGAKSARTQRATPTTRPVPIPGLRSRRPGSLAHTAPAARRPAASPSSRWISSGRLGHLHPFGARVRPASAESPGTGPSGGHRRSPVDRDAPAGVGRRAVAHRPDVRVANLGGERGHDALADRAAVDGQDRHHLRGGACEERLVGHVRATSRRRCPSPVAMVDAPVTELCRGAGRRGWPARPARPARWRRGIAAYGWRSRGHRRLSHPSTPKQPRND